MNSFTLNISLQTDFSAASSLFASQNRPSYALSQESLDSATKIMFSYETIMKRSS
jgi:hypothetical protein